MSLPENSSARGNHFIKNASVLSTRGSTITVATEEGRQVLRLLSPYGVFSIPPIGSETFYLDSQSEGTCLGITVPDEMPEPGEILLKSAGGAFILLKNNGEVIINGLVISPSGTI